MTDIFDMTAAGFALANGEITAIELTERHLASIRQLQPDLNCFVEINEGAARRAAEQADIRYRDGHALSPIDGTLIALKDNINANGFTTRNGTAHPYPFMKDADVTRQLRDAGAILVGKLNMDECALGTTTNNPHHDCVHNPWRLGYIPGGSSGGAGAAVAAHLVMAAIGTDTLGSVRLPAAYCGVVGLKATQGMVSTNGIVPLSQSLDHVGPICRSVRDAALMLNILVDNPAENWSCDPVTRGDLKGLRLGILEQTLCAGWTAEVSLNFNRVKSDFQNAGATIEVLSISELDLRELRLQALLLIESEGAEALSKPLLDHPCSFSENLKAMLAYGRNAPLEKKENARNVISRISQSVRRAIEQVDLLISPTAPQTAFPFSDPTPGNQAELTALANISGCPAITIPSGLDASGLPLAVQLMAPDHQEARLLSVALYMEGIWGTFSPPLTTTR